MGMLKGGVRGCWQEQEGAEAARTGAV